MLQLATHNPGRLGEGEGGQLKSALEEDGCLNRPTRGQYRTYARKLSSYSPKVHLHVKSAEWL